MAPVSWKLIEHGWTVLSRDGEEIGRVFLVVGDENEDIFDGIAIAHHRGFAIHNSLDRPRYVEASKVGAIDDSGSVTLSITAADAEQLPVHEAPESAEILPDGAGPIGRLRTEIEHLTGEDHTY